MLFLATQTPTQSAFPIDPLTIMMLVVLAAMIFFMFRSNRKRREQQDELLSKMVPGAEVMTNFGLFGVLRSVDEERNEAVIEVSPGTTVRVHRQTLARVVEDEAVADDRAAIADDVVRPIDGDVDGEPRDRA